MATSPVPLRTKPGSTDVARWSVWRPDHLGRRELDLVTAHGQGFDG